MESDKTSKDGQQGDAVVIVIMRPSGEVLMIQRPQSDTYPLYWNPVTGACEDCDGTDLLATCVREAAEEVGLAIEVHGKLYENLTYRKHFRLHWFLARVVGDRAGLPPPIVTPDPSEVAGYCWVKPENIQHLKPSFDDTHRFFREDFARVAVDAFGYTPSQG